MFDFIAFDLETTGLEPDKSQIIEIAAIKFCGDKIIDKFVTLVDPRCHIPEEASRVNGITDEMVVGKPLLSEALKNFALFCQDTLMVAHNAAFDEKFVSHSVKKIRCAAPRGIVLDTLAIARQAVPGLISYKLQSIAKHFNVQTETFHRAEADAHYCGLVFIELIKVVAAGRSKLELKRLINLSGGERRFPQIQPEPEQLGLL